MAFLYYILIFLAGMAIGSFVNAWIWRTREKLKIVMDRSICIHCSIKIKWYDNIPIFSFFCLKGQCRNCKKNIAWQYPLVELWGGIMFLGVFLFYNYNQASLQISPELIRDWVILTFLTFIFLYDLKYREITDFSTIIAGIILFVISLFFGWQTWQSMLFGIGAGAGFFLFLFLISKGKWIGGGDIRLGFFMGIILGWPLILLGLMIAYILGALTSLILIILKKKTMKSETAFGTYLALATLITMFFGENILGWYLGLVM